MGRVEGKVAIVTGGARGMGAAFAQRLVAEGAKVMLTDVLDKEGASTARQIGANARFLRHDVTREDEWRKTVEATEAAFGPVSILVNNAGIVTYSALETLEEADYRRVIDINQVSVFLGMKSVVASMTRAGGGSIINMSSAAGLIGAPGALAYTASKFAVRGMTKSAAIELAAQNIRVNSIHPGTILTPMTHVAGSEDLLEAVKQATPARRLGEPDEVASIVLLLASDEAKFCTGSEFVIDGGLTSQ